MYYSRASKLLPLWRMDQPPLGPTARQRARKRALLAQLDRLGWHRRGSLLQVWNRCGTPGCHDHIALHTATWGDS